MDSPLARTIFRWLNRFFMVPAFRLGLGPIFGTPPGGYVMVMKTIGWKSGKVRYVPVNYALHEGDIYCLSGFGKIAHWYRNLMAHPEIDLILPGRTLQGMVEDATDQEDALDLLRQILKNAGFASFLAGINPFSASDEKLRELTAEYCLIRIRPTGVRSGAADPGGWLWLIWIPILIWVLWWIF